MIHLPTHIRMTLVAANKENTILVYSINEVKHAIECAPRGHKWYPLGSMFPDPEAVKYISIEDEAVLYPFVIDFAEQPALPNLLEIECIDGIMAVGLNSLLDGSPHLELYGADYQSQEKRALTKKQRRRFESTLAE